MTAYLQHPHPHPYPYQPPTPKTHPLLQLSAGPLFLVCDLSGRCHSLAFSYPLNRPFSSWLFVPRPAIITIWWTVLDTVSLVHLLRWETALSSPHLLDFPQLHCFPPLPSTWRLSLRLLPVVLAVGAQVCVHTCACVQISLVVSP